MIPKPPIKVETFTTPERTFMNSFCLRSIESGQQDAGGFDMYISIIQANFSAGKAVVDLSTVLRPGAKFNYIVLGETRTHTGATATVNGMPMSQGQAQLATEAFTDATTGITNTNILTQTTKTGMATVILLYNPRDHA